MKLRKIVLAKLLLSITLAVLISPMPIVSAVSVGITLNSSSCFVYPAAGRPSCSTSGTANSDTVGEICVSASYDSSLFSVSISTHKWPGLPEMGSVSCQQDATDVTFSSTVTYVSSNCVAGSYPITYTASQGGVHDSKTFTVNVNCQIQSPWS